MWQALILQAVGTGLDMYGTSLQTGAQAKAYDRSREEKIRLARETGQTTQYSEEQYRREGQKALAEIESRYASAGVGIEGAPMQALNESMRSIEMDIRMLRRQGKLESEALLRGAETDKETAKSIRQAGKIKMFSSALNFGGSAWGTMGGGK